MTPIYTAICEHARQSPMKVAIQTIDNNKTISLTYGQLQRTLSMLHETVETWQGKRVALYAHNDIDWVILDLALSTVGAVVVPIPLFFSASQIAHLLQDAQIETVYVGSGLTLPIIDNMENWVIADTPETKSIKSEQATHIKG
ncbi:AMP-binding protein, partial [Psychrobacter proteolyticus]